MIDTSSRNEPRGISQPARRLAQPRYATNEIYFEQCRLPRLNPDLGRAPNSYRANISPTWLEINVNKV